MSTTLSFSSARPAPRRPSPSLRSLASAGSLAAALIVATFGCGSGAATGTSSGAGSASCTADTECTAFSSTCCDCANSAAHTSEVRGLTPSCAGEQRCASTASCTNDSRMAQCESGKCVLRTAANLPTTGYDQSCKVADDCVGVSTDFACASCGRTPSLAINKAGLAAFQKAYAERFAGFRCPDATSAVCPDVEPKKPVCENNVCKIK